MNTNQVDWAGEVQSAISAMKEETQKAYTYIKQEASEVAKEYVQWKAAESSICLAGCLAVCVIASWGTWRACKTGNEPACIITVPAALLAFALACGAGVNLAKCIVAPRIVILDGIKEVVR